MKHDATAFIDEPATGQVSDNTPVEWTLVDVQDVMDIDLWKTELRVLDQPLHLVVVLPLIDIICSIGKGQHLYCISSSSSNSPIFTS